MRAFGHFVEVGLVKVFEHEGREERVVHERVFLATWRVPLTKQWVRGVCMQ